MATVAHPSAEAIATIAREAQQAQLESIDGLDTKASGMVAFDGLVLTLLFTSEVARTHWNLGLSAGAAALGASTIPLLLALIPRQYRHNPNVIALAPAYMEQPPEDTNRIVALSIARGIALNQNLLRLKSGGLRIGLALTTVGVAVTAASLIYSVT